MQETCGPRPQAERNTRINNIVDVFAASVSIDGQSKTAFDSLSIIQCRRVEITV